MKDRYLYNYSERIKYQGKGYESCISLYLVLSKEIFFFLKVYV